MTLAALIILVVILIIHEAATVLEIGCCITIYGVLIILVMLVMLMLVVLVIRMMIPISDAFLIHVIVTTFVFLNI